MRRPGPTATRPSTRRGEAAIGWAKAPDHSGEPSVRAMLDAATAADRAEYLQAGFRPLACRRCGTGVLVKKNSLAHTSVQWTSDARASCPEFAARAPGGGTAQIPSCPYLHESIRQAIYEGALEVPGLEPRRVPASGAEPLGAEPLGAEAPEVRVPRRRG